MRERRRARERLLMQSSAAAKSNDGPLPLEYIMPSRANALLCLWTPQQAQNAKQCFHELWKATLPRCLRSACACQDLLTSYRLLMMWASGFVRHRSPVVLLVVVQLVPETHTLCFWSSNAMNVMFCACLGGFYFRNISYIHIKKHSKIKVM